MTKASPLTISVKELKEYRTACPAFGVDVDTAANDQGEKEVVVTIGFLPDDESCQQCLKQDEGMAQACQAERDAYHKAQKEEQEKETMDEEQTQTTEETTEEPQVEETKPDGNPIKQKTKTGVDKLKSALHEGSDPHAVSQLLLNGTHTREEAAAEMVGWESGRYKTEKSALSRIDDLLAHWSERKGYVKVVKGADGKISLADSAGE